MSQPLGAGVAPSPAPASESSLESPRPRRALRAVGVAAAMLSSFGCAPTPPGDAPALEPQRFDPSQGVPEDPSAFADLEPVEPTYVPLIGAPARRTRTIAALMFDIGRGPPDKAQVQNLLTGTSSLQKMYQQISYGMQDLQIDLLGPYTLDQNVCLPIECCGPKTSQPNGPQVQGIIAALPSKYDHYFWVYGGAQSVSGCGTWGDQGTPGRYAVYSSYSFHGLVGYTQELGHNFGMTHEPIMTCPSKAVFLDDPTQCTHKEYGSQLSFMGNGPRNVSAYHSVAQGWLSKCNGVKVNGSGKYNLLPLETPCNGAQVLQIRAPKSRAAPAKGDRQGSAPMLTHYYLELRTPQGFDSKVGPMVVVSIGPDFELTRAAPYVYVLDQTPGDSQGTTNGGLTAGQTFEDPAGGLSFTVTAIDSTRAEVTITSTGTGADTCLDGSAFTAPGLDASSCTTIGGGVGGASSTGGTSNTGGAAGTAGKGGAGAGGVAGGKAGGGAGGASSGAGGVAPAGAGGVLQSGGVAAAGMNAVTGGAATGGLAGMPGVGTGGLPSSGGSGSGGAPGFGGTTGPGNGGIPATSAGAPSAGLPGVPGVPPVDAGCACSVPARSEGAHKQLMALLGAGVAVALARRRRGVRPKRRARE